MKTTNKELLGSFDLKSECEKCKKIYDKKDLIEELICSDCCREWTRWVKYDNGKADYEAFLKWERSSV